MEKSVLKRVLAIIKEQLDADACAETNISVLPMDSLEFAAILQEIRSEIGPIDDDDAIHADTVRDLCACIQLPSGTLA